MIKFIDVTGKTEDEAIQSALAQLGMDRDDVSVEILERAKAGFLGIGSAPARVRVSYDDGKAEEVKPVEKPAASFLAPGTVFEGTLRSAGDVEIAGSFKGDLSTEGTVVLRSNIHGNVTACSLDLNGCKLEGDVTVKGLVSISQDSAICGNVIADELKCAGQITGDLKIKENTLLESTAKITGNVTTGTIAVMKGATMNGGIEIKSSDA